MDTQALRESSWFHATTSHDWFARIDSTRDYNDGTPPLVHVGTREAAMDRARVFVAHSGENADLTVTLLEFRLANHAKVAVGFEMDEENLWEVEANKGKMHGIDAQPYVNRFESPGSISLLVNPDLLVLESGKDITALI